MLLARQTLSQLCRYDFDFHLVTLHDAPIRIVDYPRFQHRGLLVGKEESYYRPDGISPVHCPPESGGWCVTMAARIN